MFCKYCGMESDSADRCSWCHKPLTPTAQPSVITASVPTPEPREAEPAPTPPIVVREIAMPPAPATIVAEPPVIALVPPPASPAASAGEPPKITPEPQTATPAPATSGRPLISIRRPAAPRVVETPSHTPEVPPPPIAEAPAPEPVKAEPPAKPPATERPSAVAARPPSTPVVKTEVRSHAPAPAIPIPQARPLNPPAGAISPASSGKTRPTAPSTASPSVPSTPAATGTASVPVTSPRPKAPAAPVGQSTSNRPTAPIASASRGGSAATLVAPIAQAGGLAEGMALAPATKPAYAPELTTIRPERSKYYADVVVDPVSGTHYDTTTGKPLVESARFPAKQAKEPDIVLHWDTDEPNTNANLGKFLGLFSVALLIAGVTAYAFSSVYWLTLMLCNLAGGMLLPMLRVGPWHDEDADDAGWIFLGTLVAGPVVSLIGYGTLTFLRKEANASVFGCLALSALGRFAVEFGAGWPTMRYIFIPWQSGQLNVTVFLVSWAGLASLLGWVLANSFHKLDE